MNVIMPFLFFAFPSVYVCHSGTFDSFGFFDFFFFLAVTFSAGDCMDWYECGICHPRSVQRQDTPPIPGYKPSDVQTKRAT